MQLRSVPIFKREYGAVVAKEKSPQVEPFQSGLKKPAAGEIFFLSLVSLLNFAFVSSLFLLFPLLFSLSPVCASSAEFVSCLLGRQRGRLQFSTIWLEISLSSLLSSFLPVCYTGMNELFNTSYL
jgi:hypothetical protein